MHYRRAREFEIEIFIYRMNALSNNILMELLTELHMKELINDKRRVHNIASGTIKCISRDFCDRHPVREKEKEIGTGGGKRLQSRCTIMQ